MGIEIAVSERGPFITSRPFAWSTGLNESGQGFLRIDFEDCAAMAEVKAEALALARHFGLAYVDTEWLRRIKLNPKELPWDDVLQSLDIDMDEPTALNILFNEEM